MRLSFSLGMGLCSGSFIGLYFGGPWSHAGVGALAVAIFNWLGGNVNAAVSK